MQKIIVTAYARDDDEPVTEEEVMDAIGILGLSNVDVQITELDEMTDLDRRS